ncbi:MAG: energy transducer TonB, partial [Deltaproteobacteria bacterium]|nr:energy transducer TonB [Deltaproteobacteria bacterium]
AAPPPAPVAPTPAPVAAPPPPPPTPAPVPPAAPQVAQAVTPPPAATPAAPPAVADPVIAQLSQATVQMVASDHSSQLGKCDSSADNVHGGISVTFQIDASGKVVKSQLSSTVKNPKLAACILRAVTSWKFPKPPTGAAKGTYSIDYQ